MAASPAAVPSPKTDGGNALAALLAAAAASMHRQQQQQQQQQQHHQQQNQQQTHANVETEVHHQSIANTSCGSSSSSSRMTSYNKNTGGLNANFKNDYKSKSKSTTKQQQQQQQHAFSTDNQKGINNNSRISSDNMNQTIQQELEAKRDTLCQLLNLKPASLIDSHTSVQQHRSPANAPPLNNFLINCNNSNNNNTNNSNKRSTSSSPSSINHLLFSSSKSRMSENQQHNHNHHFQTVNQNVLDKSENMSVKHVETTSNGHQGSARKQPNGIVKVPVSYGNNASYKDPNISVNGQHKKQATNKSINNIAATTIGMTTKQPRNKTNHKSSTSSSSSISTSTDKDSTCATKFLVSLVNGTFSSPSSSSKPPAIESADLPVELRNLESWYDEDEGTIDDSCYGELVDPSNSNGWSADEMFKYNEKMHKITSSYNEKTLSDNYTTPLRKINSKTTMQRVTQLAKEIEDRVLAEGRITPESSDDDELYENDRMQRLQLKQKKQLDQLKSLQRQQHLQQHRFTMMNNNASSSKTTQSSSQYSNSTETPATASLSSSPTLNETIIKPVTSSSRNILRACLT